MSKVAAFYAFVALERPAEIREELLSACTAGGLLGTILVSREGINGTVAGRPEAVDAFAGMLRPAFEPLEIKFSEAPAGHFDRLKVRVKREIITFGESPLGRRRARHIEASDWNALLDEPDVLLLDTRNGFEVAMGSFEGAVDPGLTRFGDFKGFVDNRLGWAREKKIAMFCTGGIRCEKAGAYMLAAGFAEVAQLRGGILRYLEEVPEASSKWRGGCFVFDRRIALGHGLRLKTSKLHPNSLDTAR